MNQEQKKLPVDAAILKTNQLFPEIIKTEKEEKKKKKESSSMTKLELTAWYFVPTIYIIFTVSYFATCSLI
jgi:hypothetical protein